MMIIMAYHRTIEMNIWSVDNMEGVQHGSVWVTLTNQCEVQDSMIEKKNKTAEVNVWM